MLTHLSMRQFVAVAAAMMFTSVGLAERATAQGDQDARALSIPEEGTEADDGWVTLFDGESMEGWKINENDESWKIEDGAFVANGNRSHLFYVGDLQPMTNFELKVEVMTREGSNGGIYFHTEYQDTGWPAKGYESQVNNTQRDPQKTGGLYNTVRVLEAPAEDDVWWTQHIIVNGNHVIVKIDDQVVVDYEEPDDKEGPVCLSEGTIAFQAHDPGSTVYFRNIRVKILDDQDGE